MWNIGMTERPLGCSSSPGTWGFKEHPESLLLAWKMEAVRFWLVSITPLGGPVVPEEKGRMPSVSLTSKEGLES